MAALLGEIGDGAAGILRQVRRDRNLHAIPVRDAAPVVEAVAFDIGADAVARLFQMQAFDHGRHAAGLHPLRHQVLQRVGTGGVGMGVAIDIDAARLGVGDHLQAARGLAPIVHAGAFEMHDLDMDLADLRDMDRFLDRFDHMVRFIADMGEVTAIVFFHDIAERDHLVRRGVGTGRGEQAR